MPYITFPNRTTEQRAVAFMIGKFQTRATLPGIHLVPQEALAALTEAGIEFKLKVPSNRLRPGESPDDVVIQRDQSRERRDDRLVIIRNEHSQPRGISHATLHQADNDSSRDGSTPGSRLVHTVAR